MKLAANNINIRDEALLLTPEQLKAELPLSAKLADQIDGFRKEIADIIAVVLQNPEDTAKHQDAAKRVAALCEKYPLYPNL